MKNLAPFALALIASTFGCSTSSTWDPQAATSLRAQPEALLRDLDSGDVDDMLARMDEEPFVFDLDENNRPLRADGRAKVAEYLHGLEQAVKSGVRFHSTISKSDCTATRAFGYCALEFEQSVTAGGQTSPPSKLRATLVARKVGDAWRWTHWHSSFRELPAPPGPPK